METETPSVPRKRGPGRPLLHPGEKCFNFTMRIPDSLREQIRQAAEARGCKQSVVIRDAINSYIGVDDESVAS